MVARSSEKAFMKKNGRTFFRRSAVFLCSENGAIMAAWQRILLDCIHSGLLLLKGRKNEAKDSKIKIILLVRI